MPQEPPEASKAPAGLREPSTNKYDLTHRATNKNKLNQISSIGRTTRTHDAGPTHCQLKWCRTLAWSSALLVWLERTSTRASHVPKMWVMCYSCHVLPLCTMYLTPSNLQHNINRKRILVTAPENQVSASFENAPTDDSTPPV